MANLAIAPRSRVITTFNGTLGCQGVQRVGRVVSVILQGACAWNGRGYVFFHIGPQETLVNTWREGGKTDGLRCVGSAWVMQFMAGTAIDEIHSRVFIGCQVKVKFQFAGRLAGRVVTGFTNRFLNCIAWQELAVGIMTIVTVDTVVEVVHPDAGRFLAGLGR